MNCVVREESYNLPFVVHVRMYRMYVLVQCNLFV